MSQLHARIVRVQNRHACTVKALIAYDLCHIGDAQKSKKVGRRNVFGPSRSIDTSVGAPKAIPGNAAALEV